MIFTTFSLKNWLPWYAPWICLVWLNLMSPQSVNHKWMVSWLIWKEYIMVSYDTKVTYGIIWYHWYAPLTYNIIQTKRLMQQIRHWPYTPTHACNYISYPRYSMCLTPKVGPKPAFQHSVDISIRVQAAYSVKKRQLSLSCPLCCMQHTRSLLLL